MLVYLSTVISQSFKKKKDNELLNSKVFNRCDSFKYGGMAQHIHW